MEVLDNVIVSTEWMKNTIRNDIDEVKRIENKMYPSLGISNTDDVTLLEAMRVYKKYLVSRNKRNGV